eukprot:CAMPEP_0206224406 /NCGR_PEP_ID=MMETSP0047_2-20121206/7007_1 /ASSEMBLY_ACC=CAM_ASM_000192 /TAXON_ID=195065 /ORGANISM="Chroomonas mesostigmatica_cf, Strain CCMP1168" /LENGTH=144 /DNA_ID=CAMNT_0053647357 /DNA_START=54 /DNA_END=488 /DNA_ORIENTATION=-
MSMTPAGSHVGARETLPLATSWITPSEFSPSCPAPPDAHSVHVSVVVVLRGTIPMFQPQHCVVSSLARPTSLSSSVFSDCLRKSTTTISSTLSNFALADTPAGATRYKKLASRERHAPGHSNVWFAAHPSSSHALTSRASAPIL